MKRIIALSLAGTLSACASPEQLVDRASDECAMIGYDISQERVATLQCTERGYRIAKSQQTGPVQALVLGVTIAAAASNMQ